MINSLQYLCVIPWLLVNKIFDVWLRMYCANNLYKKDFYQSLQVHHSLKKHIDCTLILVHNTYFSLTINIYSTYSLTIILKTNI